MSSAPSATSPVHGLFLGQVADDLLYPFPEQDPDQRETTDQAVDAFREWARDNIDARAIDAAQEIPSAVRDGLAELGIMGMTVPEAHGGYGFGMTAYCRMVEELTRAEASLSVYVGAHLSIGARPIILFGSPEQQAQILPGVATGETLCAFALTEPGAGSDAGSMRTRAVWDPEKKVYRINGNKIWITNGGYAKLFTVFARGSGGPAGEGEGFSAFIVRRGTPGFSNGPSEHKLGIRGTSTTELAFVDVEVPPEDRVGPWGEGFQIALQSLETGRLSLGAGCTGGAKEMVRLAVEHARERRQFRHPIIEFGMIREKLGRMAAAAYGAESAVYLAAGLYDQKRADVGVEAGYCKVLGSETLWQAVNDTIQTTGGIGYMTEYPYERHLRDSRINLIFEGTNEILRLSGTLEALKEPGRRVTEALKAEKAELGAAGLAAAMAVEGMPAARSAASGALRWVTPALASEAEQFAATLAVFSDTVRATLRKHRRAILGAQYTIRRLADAAMQLYAAAASLSRASTLARAKGEDGARREILLTRRFVEEACRRARHELDVVDGGRDGLDDEIAGMLAIEGRYPSPLFT
ncbi:MAG: acyl-CoA dehydrogenase family protein [Acidobacteria bacterium]|nr:acyl-CoA dehydrogenase family protein [Acidobacteriota bacterium]